MREDAYRPWLQSERTWTAVHYYSPYTGYQGGWYLFSEAGELHCRNVTWTRLLRYLAAITEPRVGEQPERRVWPERPVGPSSHALPPGYNY